MPLTKNEGLDLRTYHKHLLEAEASLRIAEWAQAKAAADLERFISMLENPPVRPQPGPSISPA